MNDNLKQTVAEASIVFILTDENVAPLWLSEVRQRIGRDDAVEIIVEAGEQHKNLQTVQLIWETLMEHHADRNALLVNLGGGVITDIGGFAASTYKRGVKFINVPTTLLAMVDAAIGGKTGIDFGSAKNQIGTFAEAEEVLIDPVFLMTLSRREVLSGLSEIYKYGFIADPSLLDINIENYQNCILRTGEIKQEIVAKDPHERGLRKILNFGHTIGHAIESHSLTTDCPLLHGEAVALGIQAALWLSFKQFGLDENVLRDFENKLPVLLSKAEFRFTEADIEPVLGYLVYDKKNKGKKPQFILLKAVGKPVCDVEIDAGCIRESLEYVIEMCQAITESDSLTSVRKQNRHCGLDPQSPVQIGLPKCSGDGGCSSALTMKSGRVIRFGEVILPPSKSESNRALMIAAYGGFPPDFRNLSDSNDTLLLYRGLQKMTSASFQTNPIVIDIEDCGTAARFLTTYCATHAGDWLLTGSERMRQRPIKPLVDALMELGADIEYADKQGFLPLRIKGKPLMGGRVSIDMTQSSQYASSLVLAAPMWPHGLELELLGHLSSLPYLDMTLAMMRHFGAEVERQGRAVVVRTKAYQPTDFTVSADWTAASYWYEMAAFSESCEIRLKSLSLSKGRPNHQGDSIIAEWMLKLGVSTSVEGDTLVIRKVQYEKVPMSFDFTNHPDLYPTITATCAGLGIEAEFVGLDNLRHKESDRVAAMQTELAKIGQSPLRFCSHNDHRVVLSLAPLALLFGSVSFDHPEVVSKSYPGFWNDAAFLKE